MKEKPKMYQNKVNKVFHNNKLVYMSGREKKEYNVDRVNDIRMKIDNFIL